MSTNLWSIDKRATGTGIMGWKRMAVYSNGTEAVIELNRMLACDALIRVGFEYRVRNASTGEVRQYVNEHEIRTPLHEVK